MNAAFLILGSPLFVLHSPSPSLPWAVHISDGLLAPTWLIAGWVFAGSLALVGAWRIREEEIPLVALLTAAFFVASSIHVQVGPGSYHLLLGGLVGVVLGRRAALAIPVGLAMQAILLGHGGYTTIGINSCIQTVAAFLAWWLFGVLKRTPWVRRPWFRAVLVAVSVVVWVMSLAYSVGLLCAARPVNSMMPDTALANALVFHPATLMTAAALAVLAAWAERRLGNAPEFPLGLVVGELAVLLAVGLKCLVLVWGGAENLAFWALVELIGHLPIAVIEGVVLGFTVGFLAKVKPELLGIRAAEKCDDRSRSLADAESPCPTGAAAPER